MKKGNQLEGFKRKHKKKDGSEINVEIHPSSVEIDELQFAVVRAKEITESGNIETSLRKSEAQKQAILDGITTNIAFVDSDLRIMWANKAAANSVGMSPDDMDGKKCYELWADPAKPCDGCPTVKAFQTGKSEKAIIHTPDGRVWEERGEPVHDSDGNLIGVIEVARDITEQKKIEEALIAAKRNYESLTKNINIGVFQSTPDGRFMDVSDRIVEMAGYESKDELLRTHASELYAEISDRDKLIEELKKNGFVRNRELLSKRKDGSVYWVRMHIILTSDSEGEPVSLFGTIEDIDEKKQNEEQMKFLSSISEQVTDSVVVTDTDFNISFVNNATLRLFGYEKEEMIGRRPDFLNAEPAGESQAKIYASISRGESWDGIMLNRRKDGSTFHNEFSVSPMYDENGNITSYISIQRDVTERKKTDDELKLKSLVLDQIHDHVTVTDLDGVITYVNQAQVKTLGIPKEKLIGKTVKEYGEDPRRSVTQNGILESTKRDGHWRGEITNFSADGSRHIMDARTQVITGDSGEAVALVGFASDITERKKIENDLMCSEERYRNFYLKTPVMLHSIDTDGRLISVSDKWLEVMGYEREEVIGRKSTDFLTSESLKYATEIVMPEFLASGFCENIPYQFVKKDGSLMDVLLSATAETDADGNIVQSLAVLIDVTERKRTENDLKQANEIINNSNVVVFLWKNEPGWPVEFVSENVGRNLGYSASEFMEGKVEYGSIIHPDDFEVVAKEVESYSLINESCEFAHQPYRIVLADGNEKWVDDRTYIKRNENGEITHYQGIVLDITEQIKVQEALKASERESNLVFESVPIPMMIVDQNRKVLKANYAMRMMGGDDRDIVGMRGGEAMRCVYQLEDPRGCGFGIYCDSCGVRNMVLDTLLDCRDHFQEEHEVHIERDGAEVAAHMIASSVSLRTDVGNFALVIIEDITERKIIEKEKEALREQLMQSQKMDAIGHLAGGVAHDFNNMLGIIMGSAQLAMSELRPDSESYREQVAIVDTAKRAKDLTAQLLTFARREEPDVKPVNINELIRNLVEMLGRSLPKTIRVEAALDENMANVLIDENQIRQALLNICNNAADAMPDGGVLSVSTKEFDSTVSSEDTRKFCCLRISDTGAGISENMLGQIFDPFFTTKGVGKGTGLGLSVTHGIIKSHKGRISVESEPGRGTTVVIYLPFTDKRAVKEMEVEEQLHLRGSERILIVDDEDLILKVTSKLLSKQGYDVVTASGGKEAIDIFREHHGGIDLVVLDFIMPEMDAWDVYSSLKRIQPDVNVIIASGYSEEGEVSELIRAGARGFVQKPFEIENLCEKIRKVMDE